MAKVRVYELAKEFGIESKAVVAKLQEMGEFVRSASSTVEAPVVRRLKEQFVADGVGKADGGKPAGNAKPAKAEKAAKPAAKSAAGTTDGASPATQPAAAAGAPVVTAERADTAGTTDTNGTTDTGAGNGAAPVEPTVRAVPKPGPRVGPDQARPKPPAEADQATSPASTERGPSVDTPAEPVAPAVPEFEAPAARAAEPAEPAEAGADDGTSEQAAGTTTPRPGPRGPKPTPPGPRPKGGRGQAGQGGQSGPAGQGPGRPRPGNNPFTSTTGMQGPRRERGDREKDRGERAERAERTDRGDRGDRPQKQGGPSGGGGAPGGGPRPNPAMMPTRPESGGGPRPNPGMMPSRPAGRGGPGGGQGGQGGPGGRGGGQGGPGGRGGGQGGPGARSGGAPAGRTGGAPGGRPGGAPGGAPGGRPGGPPGGAGRPGGGFAGRPGGPGRGGRGQTAGAFGRPGGPSRRGRKSKRQKRQEFDNMQAPAIGGVRVPRGNGASIRLHRGASLTDFAEKIGADPAALVQVMFHLGEMVTATQSVSDETLQLLGSELQYEIEVVSPEDEDRELLESFALEFGQDAGLDGDLQARPPVVSVMGHVDHGKTKLLDALRDEDVVAGEAGGITQHIGAYQVSTEVDDAERKITFIDTPGHEAFTAMRARGAQSTDIAVLVVAANDGVMPQTVEALNHAKAASVPVVVAVNKIDLPEADPTKVRGQLAEYGLVPEEYGGDTMFVDISAKGQVNLDGLLEAIVLTADASLDLRANPHQDAEGLAIEAHLDKGRGPVATVLVQRGTLRVGDSIIAGPAHGRVRAMVDEHGKSVTHAEPARPVLVLGLSTVPRAGDNFMVVDDDRKARQIAEKREARERNASFAKRMKRISLEDLTTLLEQRQSLNLVVKGDVSGSVEALEDALAKIDVGEEVDLRILHRGVGAITENDVNLAAIDNAIIIGFNVRPQGRMVDRLADREGVEIRYYSVIYQAIEEVESALKGLLKPEYEEAKLGSAEVREVFRSSKLGLIAGCVVTSGLMRRNAKARLIRDSVVVVESTDIASLKRFKDDATEVREGFECGLTLSNVNEIKVGDVIETYETREKPRA